MSSIPRNTQVPAFFGAAGCTFFMDHGNPSQAYPWAHRVSWRNAADLRCCYGKKMNINEHQ